MKKSLLVLLMMLLILPTVFAEEQEVNVTLPEFDVSLNGMIIENVKEAFPFITYNGITYIPMTWSMSGALGLESTWTAERGLKVSKGTEAKVFEAKGGFKNVLGKKYKAQLVNFPVEVNGKVIDNATLDYPLLVYKNTTYFPMTYEFMVNDFKCGYQFDADKGFSISADPNIEMLIPEPESFNYVYDTDVLEEKSIEVTEYFRLEKPIEIDNYLLFVLSGDKAREGQLVDISMDFYDQYGRYNYTRKMISGWEYIYNDSDFGHNVGFYVTEDMARIGVNVEYRSPAVAATIVNRFKEEKGVEIELITSKDISKALFQKGGMKYFESMYSRCENDYERISDSALEYAAVVNHIEYIDKGKPVNVIQYVDGSIKEPYLAELNSIEGYENFLLDPTKYSYQLKGYINGVEVKGFNSGFIYLYDENKELKRILVVRDLMEK